MKLAFSVATLLALSQAVKLENKSGSLSQSDERKEHWSEMKNFLDEDDDGSLTGAELQGYASETELEEAWRTFDFEPSEDQFVDITFDDFNFVKEGDGCIRLSEFQDALETDSSYYNRQFSNAAGSDDCLDKDEWRTYVLQYYRDELWYSRADFFDRVYGGNCDFWESWMARYWHGYTVPQYCHDDNFIESTDTDLMSA